MLACNVLLDALVNLLAADTVTLANVAAMQLHLAAAPFTPSPSLAIGSLTEATFTGSTALAAGTGTQQVFVDPVTGLRSIDVKEPAGGWHWKCTATPGAAETIYGVYLTDNTGAVLYASALFDAPIVISASGQGLDWPFARMQLVASALR